MWAIAGKVAVMVKSRSIVRQLPTVLLDMVAPYVCFLLLKRLGLSDANALAWTAVFPGLKVAYDLVRSRRLDVVGCVVIWEICLTLTLTALFHDARLILLKGPVQVAALGLACLVSLAFRSPLASTIAQLFTHKALHVGGENVGDLKAADPVRLRTVTVIWALASLADAVLRTVMIFTMPIPAYIVASRLVQSLYFTGLGVWTFGYLRAGINPNPG